jgi:ribosomal protein S27E
VTICAQVIATDSATLIEAVSVLDISKDNSTAALASAPADNSNKINGAAVARMQLGRADLLIGVQPAFTAVDPVLSSTILLRQPRLQFRGIDAESLDHIASIPLSIELAADAAVCPIGYVLRLSAPTAGSDPARIGECILCEPGTYSRNPLAGDGGPACYPCPASAVCSGGASVQSKIGTWAMDGGVYRLEACPPGHALVNTDASSGGAFSQVAQQCVACRADQYILDSSRANVSCRACPVGGVCNSSGMVSRVPGALWVVDVAAGVYVLKACPPGFEISNRDADGLFAFERQECAVCPPAYFCVGGQSGRAACRDGEFTLSGANSSAACRPTIAVAVLATLPMQQADFTADKQVRFREALADTAGVVHDQVLLRQIVQTRRDAARSGSIQVLSHIATSNEAEAAAVTASVTPQTLNIHMTRAGLPSASLKSVAVVESAGNSAGGVPWPLVGSLIGVTVVVLAASLAAVLLFGAKRELPEERQLRLTVAAVRERLMICKEHGYLLSSEQRSIINPLATRGHIRQTFAEAAAKLWLCQHFDLHQFDSFCLCLEEAAAGHGIGLSFRRQGTEPNRYALLCDWLLEISSNLIRADVPSDGDARDGTALAKKFDGAAALPTAAKVGGETGMRYFVNKVAKARIWRDDAELFERLKARARAEMGKVFCSCDCMRSRPSECENRAS